MSARRGWAVALLVLAPWIGCRSPVQEDSSDSLRSVIAQTWADHIEAGKRKDLEQVLAIYAADVVYVIPGQPVVSGIDAVREMEASTLENATVVDATHTTRSLEVFDDVAYEIGTVVGPVRVGDTRAAVIHYHFSAMWRREADGTWRIRHIVGEATPEVME